jgi:beta-glucosidase
MHTPINDEEEIQKLLNGLNLEEQVALLSGADFWRTIALPQHGIPAIKTSDGPSGARGEFFDNGTPVWTFGI